MELLFIFCRKTTLMQPPAADINDAPSIGSSHSMIKIALRNLIVLV